MKNEIIQLLREKIRQLQNENAKLKEELREIRGETLPGTYIYKINGADNQTIMK